MLQLDCWRCRWLEVPKSLVGVWANRISAWTWYLHRAIVIKNKGFSSLHMCQLHEAKASHWLSNSRKALATFGRPRPGNTQLSSIILVSKKNYSVMLKYFFQHVWMCVWKGTRQRPSDIAPYWKKDSRMWLWKSVRKARKRQLESGVQDDD